MAMPMMEMSAAPATMGAKQMVAPAPTSAGSADTGASDFSTTNIQVAGVDEADFVKNDGKYIYIESGETLTIVDAFPPEQGKIVTELPVKGTVSELFLAGDRLVIFSDTNDEHWYTPKGSAVPVPDYSRKTEAMIYDISDRKSPKEVRTISAPGSYENARMIGDYVYFITEETPDYYNPRMPIIYDGSESVEVSSQEILQILRC